MKAILVLPVRRCRHCGEDRPHRPVNAGTTVLTCCTCGTRNPR